MVQKRLSVFDIVCTVLLLLVVFVTLYPLYFTVIASVSDPNLVVSGKVWFYPKGLTLLAYRNVFVNKQIWTGYMNSIIYTLAGTSVNLMVTITCAYVLSKKRLMGRNFFMMLFAFTMYFSGGLIPTYLLVNSLGMVDKRWALIVPGAISVYNMIITRTFYINNIPEELYEAARIDGASELSTFTRVALPLSQPIIAVMALFYGVGHWNSYFSALIYINSTDLYPLQLVLRNILILNQSMAIDSGAMTHEEMLDMAKRAQLAESMKYALIFIASFPVLMIYPFMQKYFMKGVMIGAIKG